MYQRNPTKPGRIVLEKYTLIGRMYQEACDFTVTSAFKNSVFGTFYKTIQFGKSKLIAGWAERDRNSNGSDVLSYRIIQLPSCESHAVKVEAELNEDYTSLEILTAVVNILTYNDYTFDVVFPNEKLCNNDLCRSTYNESGSRIAGPIAWFSGTDYKFPKVYPIEIHSTAKGHLVVASPGTTYKALLISSNAQKNKELIIPADRVYSSLNMIGAIGYNRIGLCVNEEIHFRCIQFDLNGEVKLAPVSLNFGFETFHYGMYNLREGGFLLITVDTRFVQGVTYHITKVEAQGQRYMSLQLDDFKCLDDLNMRIIYSNVFKNEVGQYCISLACRRSHFRFVVECFSDEDLSVTL